MTLSRTVLTGRTFIYTERLTPFLSKNNKIYLKKSYPMVKLIFKYSCHLIIVGTGTGAAGVVAGQAVQRVVGLSLGEQQE